MDSLDSQPRSLVFLSTAVVVRRTDEEQIHEHFGLFMLIKTMLAEGMIGRHYAQGTCWPNALSSFCNSYFASNI